LDPDVSGRRPPTGDGGALGNSQRQRAAAEAALAGVTDWRGLPGDGSGELTWNEWCKSTVPPSGVAERRRIVLLFEGLLKSVSFVNTGMRDFATPNSTLLSVASPADAGRQALAPTLCRSYKLTPKSCPIRAGR
jgi:hypothetical protein